MHNVNDPSLIELLRNYMHINVQDEKKSAFSFFKNIQEDDLLTKDNHLYNLIHNETKNICEYLETSFKNFHLLFNKNLKDFDDCLAYLEKNAVPNQCVCAGVIDNIPGYRCVDCSKYENSIYCNECYLKSKDLHKNHKVVFLHSSSGMCDCGDPDSLYTFCSQHSGPYSEQKQIDEYISKNFEKAILDKLKSFFDELFMKLSKYFIMTEKCDYFCQDLFDEKFEGKSELENEITDTLLLKHNFCIVFKNLLDFLRLISEKNVGMLHLIATYFLKNHLNNQQLDDEYLTTHRCLTITKDEIKIFDKNEEKHICVCP